LLFEEAMTVGSSVEMLADPLPGEVTEFFPSSRALAAGSLSEVLGRQYPLLPRKTLLLPFYRVFLLPQEVFLLQNGFQRARNASTHLAETPSVSFHRFRETAAEIDYEMGSRCTGLLPPLVWPTTTDAVADLLVADTHTDLARLVLAAARFRAKNGKYPDRLDALDPGFIAAVPMDPFSVKPLQLRTSETSWTVLSKGTNAAGKPIAELTLH
jgi:hypothetical protein